MGLYLLVGNILITMKFVLPKSLYIDHQEASSETFDPFLLVFSLCFPLKVLKGPELEGI
jgi:hypothetical protein